MYVNIFKNSFQKNYCFLIIKLSPFIKKLLWQFFMTKYSDEFKIKAVQMVLNGNAAKHVTRMLNITLHSNLHD